MLLPTGLEHEIERFHIAGGLHIAAPKGWLHSLRERPVKRKRRKLRNARTRRGSGERGGGLLPVTAADAGHGILCFGDSAVTFRHIASDEQSLRFSQARLSFAYCGGGRRKRMAKLSEAAI